jgi:DNA topoisomerase I
MLSLMMSPESSAAEAGLRHSSDALPGIRRIKKGKSFTYVDVKKRAVRDAATLKRIRSLVIPPAWKDVWICTDPRGHLQATGRDAKGRKQYRYHPRWRTTRDGTKYHRMVSFGEALPRIRARANADLRKAGLPREKVLAAVVRLLEETLIRVGNEEYAKDNRSYGLTTLKDEHAQVHGVEIRFRFRGKSGQHHDIAIHDRKIAKIVKHCRELPGHELFGYVDDDGRPHDVTSEHVNAYLQEITGADFTAKDFRTWAGTVRAALTLQDFPPCTSDTEAKRNVVKAIESVAEALGNTPAVCRKCYVHPYILSSYADKSLSEELEPRLRRAKTHRVTGLSLGEAAVLAVLKDCFDS